MAKALHESSFAELKEVLSRNIAAINSSDIPFEVTCRAHMLCADFIGGIWKESLPEDTRVTRMKGGMSNLLFLCTLRDSIQRTRLDPDKVLLRVYFNPETESHLVAESVIFTLLSERQLGPSLYGIFNGGRLEEYIVSRPLHVSDIRDPSMSLRIAAKLAHIHQLQVPISKEPSYICDALNRWLTQLSLIADVKPFSIETPNGRSVEITPNSVKCEIALLRTCLERSKSPVVFCHNDLQEGNILLPLQGDANTKDIVFIDFEYASYNYRAFDFANHFCEWSIDYTLETSPYFVINSRDFPTNEQQARFMKSYLEASNLPSSQATIAEILEEIRPFVAVSHFFWGVWALLSARTSPLNFGFAEYAKQRLGYYFDLKTDLSATAETHATQRTEAVS